MDIKELEKLAEHEISWLSYYARKDTRDLLTLESDIFEDLISIGYAKRKKSLIERCVAAYLTSNERIKYGADLDKIEMIYSGRDVENNIYTSLEVYLILFPEKKQYVIDKLKI
jgi:hypothetical protein